MSLPPIKSLCILALSLPLAIAALTSNAMAEDAREMAAKTLVSPAFPIWLARAKGWTMDTQSIASMTDHAIAGLSPMLPDDCDVARMKRDLCGIKPFTIPSSSMSPSIEESELVAAQMLQYSPISRGDIIVHKAQFYDAGETIAITRVIGLPGETVEMRDGHVRINGTALANTATGQTVTSDSFSRKTYTETTPEGRRYSIMMSSDPSSGVIRDFGPVTIPEDSYFVLGDNRDNSVDSRYPQYFNGDGFIRRGNIIGVSVSVLASRHPERIGTQLR